MSSRRQSREEELAPSPREQLAASKINAAVRGHRARRSFRQLQKEDRAATLVQARVRSRLASKSLLKVKSKRKKLQYGKVEQMDLFILPDVGLQLNVHFPKDNDVTAGKFVVKGPPAKLAKIRKVAKTNGEIEGVASPYSPVTLPDQVKSAAGIPLAATRFAFIYPLQDFRERKSPSPKARARALIPPPIIIKHARSLHANVTAHHHLTPEYLIRRGGTHPRRTTAPPVGPFLLLLDDGAVLSSPHAGLPQACT